MRYRILAYCARWRNTDALAVLLGVILLLPLVIITIYSFSPGRYWSWDMRFSLRWYGVLFRNTILMDSVKNTLLLTAFTIPICLGAALATAHVIARRLVPKAEIFEIILSSTLMLPGVVTGIALLSMFGYLNVNDGLVRMTVAMSIFCLPMAVNALLANYSGLNPALEEAAEDLGAKAFQKYRKVILPQLKPGVVAALVFILVETVDNFTINVFLADSNSMTLPIATYQRMRTFDDPVVAVIAVLMGGLSIVLVGVLSKLVGLERALTQEGSTH